MESNRGGAPFTGQADMQQIACTQQKDVIVELQCSETQGQVHNYELQHSKNTNHWNSAMLIASLVHHKM